MNDVELINTRLMASARDAAFAKARVVSEYGNNKLTVTFFAAGNAGCDGVAYYVHDGNKNVSEVVAADGEVVAHYEYAPFGAVAFQSGERADENVWRFSSECADDDLMLTYYNYRHYDPSAGRWLARDPIDYGIYLHKYVMLGNNPVLRMDELGLDPAEQDSEVREAQKKNCNNAKKQAMKDGQRKGSQIHSILSRLSKKSCSFAIFCRCCPQSEGSAYSTDGITTSQKNGANSTVVMCVNGEERPVAAYKMGIIHELVHVLDHCEKGQDIFDPSEAVCSEIHAYSACGGCKDGGLLRLVNESEAECIKRGAIASSVKKHKWQGRKGVNKLKEKVAEMFDNCICEDAKGRIENANNPGHSQNRGGRHLNRYQKK